MGHHFEIFKDKVGEYRVRFKYNSEVIFSTDGYSSKASAKNAIESIKKNGPGCDTFDNTDPKKPQPKPKRKTFLQKQRDERKKKEPTLNEAVDMIADEDLREIATAKDVGKCRELIRDAIKRGIERGSN